MQHLTITTGHSRPSPRDEVDRSLLGLCEDAMLPAILAGKPARLPRLPAYHLTGAADGGALVTTCWIATPSADRMPLATWWTVGDAAAADATWAQAMIHCQRMARAMRMTTPSCPQPTTTPWVAAWLEIGAAVDPESLGWIADLERCLAWAWLDHRRAQTKPR